MPTITVLPHETFCPSGAYFIVKPGTNLIRALINHGIIVEHACEMQGTCGTCHVYIREGLDSLASSEDKEEEGLNRAWGLEMDSRLSCQVIVGEEDLVIELPKYHTNIVGER